MFFWGKWHTHARTHAHTRSPLLGLLVGAKNILSFHSELLSRVNCQHSGSHSSRTSQPITGQYSGHVICPDQSGASNSSSCQRRCRLDSDHLAIKRPWLFPWPSFVTGSNGPQCVTAEGVFDSFMVDKTGVWLEILDADQRSRRVKRNSSWLLVLPCPRHIWVWGPYKAATLRPPGPGYCLLRN